MSPAVTAPELQCAFFLAQFCDHTVFRDVLGREDNGNHELSPLLQPCALRLGHFALHFLPRQTKEHAAYQIIGVTVCM